MSELFKSGSVAEHPNFGLINVDTASLHDALLTCRGLAEIIQKEAGKKQLDKEIIKNNSAKIIKTVLDALTVIEDEKIRNEVAEVLKNRAGS